jgi:hypothetical protein
VYAPPRIFDISAQRTTKQNTMSESSVHQTCVQRALLNNFTMNLTVEGVEEFFHLSPVFARALSFVVVLFDGYL